MAKTRKSHPSTQARAVSKSVPIRKRAASVEPAVNRGVELVRMAVLAVICILIWCSVYDRWSADHWGVPVEYGLNPAAADVKSDLAGFRAAQLGYLTPGTFMTVPRLNAPYTAEWNDYPSPEDFIFWATGLLARVIGLFAAANFLLMFAQVLAALAFYYAARRLRCAWQWSFGGALLYGLAPYAFAHSLHHVDVTCYWHIPLCLLVCFWIVNGNGLAFRTRDYWLAIGVAVVTGLQNVYYTNIFIQLAGISLIIRWMRHGRRDWRVCLPGLSIGGAAFAAFFIMVLRVPLYALAHGHNTAAVVRSYALMEFYAMKLVDFFIPFPTHRIPAFADLGRRYYAWTVLPAETPPACYFGLVGIAAFLWLATATVRNAIARPMKKIPLESVQVLWIFIFSTVGGVNAFLGVMKFQMFRSTTRYCIVILAIALLFAIRRLTILSRRWPAPWPALAPLALAAFGLWEFLPPVAGEPIGEVAEVVNSDRDFAQAMEGTLPKGAMVFQFPVMDFPESPIPYCSAYDNFRPFLYTNDLRFSFGTDKGRPINAWQRTIVGLPPAQQVAALERYGFAGIYVNREAYPDKGETMLSAYRAAGRTQILYSPLKDLCCVVLNPTAIPELPPPAPLFADGWYTEQDSSNGQRDHLAGGNAQIMLIDPMEAPIQKYASFYLATVAPRDVTLEGDGAYQSWHVDQQHPVKVTNLRLTLPPGRSMLSLTTDAPGTPGQQGPVTFDVVDFDLTDSPKPEQ